MGGGQDILAFSKFISQQSSNFEDFEAVLIHKTIRDINNVPIMVLIFDVILERFVIHSNAVNMSNNKDCSLRTNLLMSYHIIQVPWFLVVH